MGRESTIWQKLLPEECVKREYRLIPAQTPIAQQPAQPACLVMRDRNCLTKVTQTALTSQEITAPNPAGGAADAETGRLNHELVPESRQLEVGPLIRWCRKQTQFYRVEVAPSPSGHSGDARRRLRDGGGLLSGCCDQFPASSGSVWRPRLLTALYRGVSSSKPRKGQAGRSNRPRALDRVGLHSALRRAIDVSGSVCSGLESKAGRYQKVNSKICKYRSLCTVSFSHAARKNAIKRFQISAAAKKRTSAQNINSFLNTYLRPSKRI